MKTLVQLLAAFLVLITVSGCKGKQKAETAADASVASAQQLPEGTNVLAALDRKDYEAAVAGLVKIQQAIGPDLRDPFLILMQHVRLTLLDVSGTDPKAAEALNTLRFMAQGR